MVTKLLKVQIFYNLKLLNLMCIHIVRSTMYFNYSTFYIQNVYLTVNSTPYTVQCTASTQPNLLIPSMVETQESAGMLRYLAQICLQIFTSFPQMYDVSRN